MFFRLEVAVHQALLMDGREGVGDLRAEVQEQIGGPGACEQPAQVLPLDQLHHDVGERALLADVVDGDDVRVVERRGGPRFLLDARKGVGMMLDAPPDDLDRDIASQTGVEGAVRPSPIPPAPMAERTS